MTPSTPASVVASIKRTRENSATLVFRRVRDGVEEPLEIRNADRTITQIKGTLAAVLDEFRALVGVAEVALGPVAYRKGTQKLADLSYALLANLLGDPYVVGPAVERLNRLFQPVLAAAPDPPYPLVELLAQDSDQLAWFLPLELLPLSGQPEAPLSYFLGFRAKIIRRRSKFPFGPAEGKAIPTKVFAEQTLPGVGRQVTFFKRSSAYLDLLRLWPDAGVSDDADLVQELATELLKRNAHNSRSARQILHFCCHYWPAGTNPEGAFSPVARLGFGNNLFLDIPSLIGRMASMVAGTAFTQRPEAIVFLNACESAKTDEVGESLLDMLLRHGYQNVITGETLLPDRVAAAFAICFYNALFQGVSFGDAVLQARRELVFRFSNPAGLLYTAFGDPDLQLRVPDRESFRS
jgi:hypothetical protein